MQYQRCHFSAIQPCQGAAICIGTFDGMHRGHQALLDATIQAAKKNNIPSLVICFDPNPKDYFQPNHTPQLMTLDEKKRFLSNYGIDSMLCLQFDAELANLSAENFIQQILHDKLSAHTIITGYDFCFGKDRTGNQQLLKKLSAAYNYTVIQPDVVQHQGQCISSSWLRKALHQGELSLATELLGRPYSISGVVQHGAKTGRKLGFPTANIATGRDIVALGGVFVVTSHCLDTPETTYYGVANLGQRPTVDGTRTLLETYLFDCSPNLYDKDMEVQFLYKLRGEEKYASLAELSAQIKTDVKQARQWLTKNLL